jgi:leader peptidase (prepilin peptidase)/N-methyltransferase
MSVDAFAIGSFTVLGLVLGSFLNVVVYRLPLGMSVVRPRSACPTCGTPIQGRDNVPVLSYLLLRGRCRACQTHISAEYPIVEAITGALFGLTALAFPHRLVVAAMIAPFLGVMLAAALIDLRHRIIPNALTYASFLVLLPVVGVVAFSTDGVSLARAGLGLLAYGGGLMVIALVAPGGMGMGDAKLAALIGLVLGALGWRYVAVAAMVAVIAGGVGAIGALIAGRGRKDTIPFGPFLAAGAIVAALLAPQIAHWYTNLFV